MQKIRWFLLTVVLLISFVSCVNQNGDGESTEDSPSDNASTIEGSGFFTPLPTEVTTDFDGTEIELPIDVF